MQDVPLFLFGALASLILLLLCLVIAAVIGTLVIYLVLEGAHLWRTWRHP